MLFKTMNAVGTVAVVLVIAPFAVAAVVLIAAARLYRRAELHAVYGGDKAARDRDEYKMSL